MLIEPSVDCAAASMGNSPRPALWGNAERKLSKADKLEADRNRLCTTSSLIRPINSPNIPYASFLYSINGSFCPYARRLIDVLNPSIA